LKGDALNSSSEVDWPAAIHQALAAHAVRQIAYVPDAGHKRLLELCAADPAMRSIALTTEEEGIGLLAGAWLGGERGALLMQSSGVGNCINAIASITRACQFPLLLLVTMRGEWNEGNPWQVPMGSATAPVLETLGLRLVRVESAGEAGAAVTAMPGMAFVAGVPAGVLLSQRLIGAKVFK
jgi:sulfopyruvate decarboxylase alpha subunit